MPHSTFILPILHTMASVICMGGASLLFLRGRNSRSRRMLAFIMMTWGVIYVTRVVGVVLGNQDLNFTRTDVVDTLVLVIGNLYLIVLLLYPLEVVRPGWLNLKRTSILLLPYICNTVLLHRLVLARPKTVEAAQYGSIHGTYRRVQRRVPYFDDPFHYRVSCIPVPIDLAL